MLVSAKVKFAPFSSKGFGVWGLGFWGLGFGVLGFGFGVYNRLEKGANLFPALVSVIRCANFLPSVTMYYVVHT
mgnify:CR=1 FL=1